MHDDVRLGPVDSRVEKDESHAGKVMEKRLYERNKEKFPYSRFEVYDPTIPVLMCIPSEVKMAATGKGRASKDEMIAAAKVRWNHDVRNDHEADALWVGQVALTTVLQA